MEGVWLILAAPRVAFRDCEHCQKWTYDEDTGKPIKTGGNTGRLVRRRKGTAPCRLPDAGCAKGSPEESKELTPENRAAYRHYLECKAVGEFPDDPIVRRNAGIIRNMEEVVAREKESEFQSLLTDSVKLQLQCLQIAISK